MLDTGLFTIVDRLGQVARKALSKMGIHDTKDVDNGKTTRPIVCERLVIPSQQTDIHR